MNTLTEYFYFLLLNKEDKHIIKKILNHMDNKNFELIFLIIKDEIDERNNRRY